MFSISSRTEEEVFQDLEKLCSQSGFIHAVAHFCYRDNEMLVGDKLEEKDYQKLILLNGKAEIEFENSEQKSKIQLQFGVPYVSKPYEWLTIKMIEENTRIKPDGYKPFRKADKSTTNQIAVAKAIRTRKMDEQEPYFPA